MQTMEQIKVEERKRDLADIAKLMESAVGRRVLHRILETAHVYTQTFHADARVHAFQDGERNIGLIMLNDITESAPKGYQVMMLEAKERRESKRLKEQAALSKYEEGQR